MRILQWMLSLHIIINSLQTFNYKNSNSIKTIINILLIKLYLLCMLII